MHVLGEHLVGAAHAGRRRPSRCRACRGSRAAPGPCRPRRRGRAARRTPTSGASSRRRATRSWSTSIADRPRGRAARARPRPGRPSAATPARSSERPPFRTATRLIALRRRGAPRRPPRRGRCSTSASSAVGLPARPRAPAAVGAGRCAGQRRRRARPARRRPRRCGARPRGCPSSPTPEKFSRIEEPPRPSRYAARPGTNATFARERARQQVGRVDVVGQRGPDEQAALGLRPRRLGAGSARSERLEHRVAAAAVELAQRVARSARQLALAKYVATNSWVSDDVQRSAPCLPMFIFSQHRPRRDGPAEPDARPRGSSRTCRGR